MNMTISDPVATERLRLYRPTLQDLSPIHSLRSEDSSLDETRRSLESWIDHWERHGFGYWVVRNDAGEFVGIGGIEKKAQTDGDLINLYYAIAPRARRRGYAIEIVRAALDAAFSQLALDRVHAIVEPDNAGSIAVAERAGMILAGQLDPENRLLFVAERDRGPQTSGDTVAR